LAGGQLDGNLGLEEVAEVGANVVVVLRPLRYRLVAEPAVADAEEALEGDIVLAARGHLDVAVVSEGGLGEEIVKAEEVGGAHGVVAGEGDVLRDAGEFLWQRWVVEVRGLEPGVLGPRLGVGVGTTGVRGTHG